MRKNVLYLGILLFVIAIVAFAIWHSLFLNAASKVLPPLENHTLTNLTTGVGEFTYLNVPTGNDTIDTLIFGGLTGRANVYLFDSKTFYTWAGDVALNNVSARGLAYARDIATTNASVVESNVTKFAFLIVGNQTYPKPNMSKIYVPSHNLTAYVVNGGTNMAEYVVIDNTKGSASSNTMVQSSVFRVGLYPPGSVSKYNPDQIIYLLYLSIISGIIGLGFVMAGLIGKESTAKRGK